MLFMEKGEKASSTLPLLLRENCPPNIKMLALAGVAYWLEHVPRARKVAGSIPSQGINLGCRFGRVRGTY